LKQLCAVVCGPYRSGRSRQGVPVRSTKKIAFSTRRSSSRDRPIRRPSARGSTGSMIRHSASLKSDRDMPTSPPTMTMNQIVTPQRKQFGFRT